MYLSSQKRINRGILAAGLTLAMLAGAACDDGSNTPTASTAAEPAAVVTATVGTVAGQASAAAQATSAPATATTAAPAAPKLNLNTATPAQFLAVPGVGDRMVREFQEYRPYASVAQFRREIGKYVPADQVWTYLEYVFIPVDPNQADAETLQQLPGVDATDAAQIIAARPYTATEAFLTKLGQYVAADQAAAARGYLVS